MEWAKTRPAPRFDLAISNVLACSIDEIPGAREALGFSGSNDNGYAPLLGAIGARYGVPPDSVTTAQGASGANFLVCAALLEPGDDVLMERPGYDPLIGAARLMGANVIRYDRRFERGFAIEPEAIEAAMTPRTRLVIVTSPHNPTGAMTDTAALRAVGEIARRHGARVLVDEVYLDAGLASARRAAPSAAAGLTPAVHLGEPFLSTSSLTKSYGLSGLRCGWVLSSPEIATRLRRARDVVDGSGSIVTERLGTLAFEHLDRLIARTTALLDVNRPIARRFLESRPELEWVDGGGTVVFPRVRGVPDTSVLADRLFAERDTAIVPGRFFEAPAHFRLGFGGPSGDLTGGLDALAAALDRRAW